MNMFHLNNENVNVTLLSERCLKFPVQVVKYVRVKLDHVTHYLKGDARVKLIWLVRDPRGVWDSRNKHGWCMQSSPCNNFDQLFHVYTDNLVTSKKLLESYPSQFTILRWEEMVEDRTGTLNRLVNFIGLDNPQPMFSELERINAAQPLNGSMSWREKSNQVENTRIETVLKAPMEELGYL